MYEVTAVVAIHDEKCVGCQRCVNVCPTDALAMQGKLAVLDEPKCVGCFKCVEACVPYDAISIKKAPAPRQLTTPTRPDAEQAVTALCAQARLLPDAVVCVCTRTTAGEVAAALVDGVRAPEGITLATGARAKCWMWCHAPVMRLMQAHGLTLDPDVKDQRHYADSGATEVALWTIPDDVADRYPEYRLRETLEAVESGAIMSEPTPMFPDVQPAAERSHS
jgi:Fe-S-cluster-containing hydrogenase component 2